MVTQSLKDLRNERKVTEKFAEEPRLCGLESVMEVIVGLGLHCP